LAVRNDIRHHDPVRIHSRSWPGLFALLSWIALPSLSEAQADAVVRREMTFSLSSTDLADSAAMARSMPRLAAAVLETSRDDSRDRLGDHRFRLDLLTGTYGDAASHLEQSRAPQIARDPRPAVRALHVQYGIHARAKEAAARTGRPYAETFADAFRATFSRLDDPTSALVARAMLVAPSAVANDLRWATPDLTGRTEIVLNEALTLLDVYSAVQASREFAGLPQALIAADEQRRYVIEPNLPVRTTDGATVCAIVVRPRAARRASTPPSRRRS